MLNQEQVGIWLITHKPYKIKMKYNFGLKERYSMPIGNVDKTAYFRMLITLFEIKIYI